jgi:hypothetical protein
MLKNMGGGLACLTKRPPGSALPAFITSGDGHGKLHSNVIHQPAAVAVWRDLQI